MSAQAVEELVRELCAETRAIRERPIYTEESYYPAIPDLQTPTLLELVADRIEAALRAGVP